MSQLDLKDTSDGYKFEKLRDEFIRKIENNEFGVEKPIPSINETSLRYAVSKITVSRAYKHLQIAGYITYSRKKFYLTENRVNKLKILLILNKLEYYKSAIYEAVLASFQNSARVDLQIFYSDYEILKNIIKQSLNKYDYYIIMPHFYHKVKNDDIINLLSQIPSKKLLLIDKLIPNFNAFNGAVIQEFNKDIISGLDQLSSLINKYIGLRFVKGLKSHHPVESINALKLYCETNDKSFELIENLETLELESGVVYLLTTDKVLAQLIKKIKIKKFNLIEDLGIIAYNESIFNELLNVTVFSTDFYKMGTVISEMIIKQDFKIIKNTFRVTVRESV